MECEVHSKTNLEKPIHKPQYAHFDDSYNRIIVEKSILNENLLELSDKYPLNCRKADLKIILENGEVVQNDINNNTKPPQKLNEKEIIPSKMDLNKFEVKDIEE